MALKRAEDRAACRLAATIAAVNQRVTTIFTAADARRLESTDILNPLNLPQKHAPIPLASVPRSEEHTSELPSLMRLSYAVFFLQQTKRKSRLCRLSS